MFDLRTASFATGLALSLSLSACTTEANDAPTLRAEPYDLPAGEVRYADALTALDAKIESAQQRAEAEPSSWMPRQTLAGLYLQRARLSGALDDYLQAEATLDEAFDIAPTGSGPWLTQAQLSATLHRLTDADTALDQAETAILLDDPTRAAIAGIRGDVAMLRGDMQGARAHLELADELDPTSSSMARLALWHWRNGDLQKADELYTVGASRYHGDSAETRAWFELQRGILDLDLGQYDEALAHYLDANAMLSDYYLIEEHIAEILVLQGKSGEAYGLYLDIVDETDAPEFMDALAGMFAEIGDDAASEAWVEDARQRYEADLVVLPEAATGHALGHFLEFGTPERALELAQRNYELRPNPASAADLALAYVGVGELGEAVSWADVVVAGEWRGFDVYDAAAEVYGAAGMGELAAQWRGEACAVAPLRCE